MKCDVCAAVYPDGTAFCGSCGAAMVLASHGGDALKPGSKLQGGKYSVQAVLGTGGFGITYYCSRAEGGTVAIKELFPEGCRRNGSTVTAVRMDTEAYRRMVGQFLAEAQLLAGFNSAGIVKVYEAFEANGTAYMVMEYIQGESLRARINRTGALPEPDALSIIKNVARSLRLVHDKNLLHRDIKPDNIMLAPDGRVVLIDFGTVREFVQDGTRAMTSMVTPGYAPLEQRGTTARFGPYTDVYALGATLYHALTGLVPVDALDRSLGVDLKHPARIKPGLSPGVCEAVMRAMNLKASQRPQTVSEFVRLLELRESDFESAKRLVPAQDLGLQSITGQTQLPSVRQLGSDPLASAVGLQALSSKSATPQLQILMGRVGDSGDLNAPAFQHDYLTAGAGWPTTAAQFLSVILSTLLVFMTWFFLGFIVPQLTAIYSDFSGGEAQLSAMSRKTIQLSDWLMSGARWWVFVLVGVGLYLLGRRGPLLLAVFAVALAVATLIGSWVLASDVAGSGRLWVLVLTGVTVVFTVAQVSIWRKIFS